jgi:hypothetical protein
VGRNDSCSQGVSCGRTQKLTRETVVKPNTRSFKGAQLSPGPGVQSVQAPNGSLDVGGSGWSKFTHIFNQDLCNPIDIRNEVMDVNMDCAPKNLDDYGVTAWTPEVCSVGCVATRVRKASVVAGRRG